MVINKLKGAEFFWAKYALYFGVRDCHKERIITPIEARNLFIIFKISRFARYDNDDFWDNLGPEKLFGVNQLACDWLKQASALQRNYLESASLLAVFWSQSLFQKTAVTSSEARGLFLITKMSRWATHNIIRDLR